LKALPDYPQDRLRLVNVHGRRRSEIIYEEAMAQGDDVLCPRSQRKEQE